MLHNDKIQRGPRLDCQVRKVQRISSLDATKSSGFVYLVHRVASLAGCTGRRVADADRVVLSLQRITSTLDAMNDEPNRAHYLSSPDLVASAISLLEFVGKSFGHEKAIRASSIVKKYMNTLKLGFRRESEFRNGLVPSARATEEHFRTHKKRLEYSLHVKPR